MQFSFDLKIRTDFAGWSILRPPAQVGPILFWTEFGIGQSLEIISIH